MASDQKKIKLSFAENFALSGAAAVISKTAAAPIERVKLMIQNQDEMLKAGRLKQPYKGVIDCTVRTYRTEGMCQFVPAHCGLTACQPFSLIHAVAMVCMSLCVLLLPRRLKAFSLYILVLHLYVRSPSVAFLQLPIHCFLYIPPDISFQEVVCIL